MRRWSNNRAGEGNSDPNCTSNYLSKDVPALKLGNWLVHQRTAKKGIKGHKISVENKLIGGYGPISTIYKNSEEKFVGVPDIRVGTEKAFNNS